MKVFIKHFAENPKLNVRSYNITSDAVQLQQFNNNCCPQSL